MANDKNEKSRKARIIRILLIFGMIILVLAYQNYKPSSNNINDEDTLHLVEEETSTQPSYGEIPEETLYVYMIDVGQGDSFLFVQGNETALIDCGTKGTVKNVIECLNTIGITKLDYVIGTHQHDDHIGGMYDIISNFEIGEIIMPTINPELVTSNWYMSLLKKINDDNIEVIHPEIGDIFLLGIARMKVVGQLTPDEAGNNINNYSTVIKVSLGEMDILMTGDAEKQVERSILQSKENIDSEILKVGHHGSDSSTTKEFLEAVNPEYGLISCKIGNRYNHPTKETMDKLEDAGVVIYRTDECGTVAIKITATDIYFNATPGDYLSGPELEEGD